MRVIFLMLAFCFLTFCLILVGFNPVCYIHIPHLLALSVGPLLIHLIRHGASDFGRMVKGVWGFYFGSPVDRISILIKDLIRCVYVVALLIFVGSLSIDLMYVANHEDLDSGNSLESRVAGLLNIWILALLYCELFLRSVVNPKAEQVDEANRE
jgi:hypothetical protein